MGRTYVRVRHEGVSKGAFVELVIQHYKNRGGVDMLFIIADDVADEDVFPFFELRSAAVDMRGASQKSYDDAELRKRIAAQLDTCREAGVRHVVLSAFGCGAFQNPSPIVAEVYKQEVLKRKEHFDVVAFAIFHAGYGPDNFGGVLDIFEGA